MCGSTGARHGDHRGDKGSWRSRSEGLQLQHLHQALSLMRPWGGCEVQSCIYFAVWPYWVFHLRCETTHISYITCMTTEPVKLLIKLLSFIHLGCIVVAAGWAENQHPSTDLFRIPPATRTTSACSFTLRSAFLNGYSLMTQSVVASHSFSGTFYYLTVFLACLLEPQIHQNDPSW